MRLSCTLAILPLIATLFVGCGSRGPALYSVTGKVTLDGQPVPNVNVAFFPSDAKLPSSGGVTNSAGVYKLTSSQGMAGAVAAKHKVSVYGGQASGTTEPSARPEGMYKVGGPKDARSKSVAPKNESPVPERYSSADKSSLEREVAAKSNVIDLELSSK